MENSEPASGSLSVMQVRHALVDWSASLDSADDGDPARLTALCELIRWFDTAVWLDEPSSIGIQTLTRAIAAVGRLLIAHEGFGPGPPGPRNGCEG